MTPGTRAGESKVTVPEGSATSYIPKNASSMEFTKICVAGVLSMEGVICSDFMRGTRRSSIMGYSTCIRATKSARNPEGADAIEASGELSLYRRRLSVGA